VIRSVLAEPLDPAPIAALTCRTLHVAAERAAWDPYRQRKDANSEFDVGETRSYIACGTGEDGGALLMLTGRVQRLVALHIMTFNQRFVSQGVLDLNRLDFEQSSFSLSVASIRHSSACMVLANSR
jgi:hypothetical protein